MKKDIETRADIEFLLNEFYAVALSDAEIGHHFVELDLVSHLPVITDFWEKLLFGTPVYFGNPLEVHKKINIKSTLLQAHFDRWVKLFCEKVDLAFAGERAEFAKERARQIAQSLHSRIDDEKFPAFIK